MNVPPLSEPRWRDLVVGKIKVDFDFLATKILLTRISAIAAFDPNTIPTGTHELQSLFAKNADVPKVQSDLVKIFGARYRLGPAVYNAADVASRIEEGRVFLLGGSEATLKNLPRGRWIGGTTPHVRDEGSGLGAAGGRLFATELPEWIESVRIVAYKEATSLRHIYLDAPERGFSVIILPASSPIHFSFALESRNYPSFATRPLAGWVSGVPTEQIGKASPKVFHGQSNEPLSDGAVVMHVSLRPDKFAEIGVVNVFEQGVGDTITVMEDGFSHQYVIINGERVPFAEYIREKWIDTRLPLVADYNGLMFNSSFQGIDTDNLTVKFYAPLFRGLQYRLARPVDHFEAEFLRRLPKVGANEFIFSFNCILNHRLFSGLEAKTPEALLGPTTFGEVAYQLLNQTLVFVSISDLGNSKLARH